MKVFEFEYEVDYGGGIMLFAASTQEEAEEYVSIISTGFGRWVFSQERTDLVYTENSPNEILSYTRAE